MLKSTYCSQGASASERRAGWNDASSWNSSRRVVATSPRLTDRAQVRQCAGAILGKCRATFRSGARQARKRLARANRDRSLVRNGATIQEYLSSAKEVSTGPGRPKLNCPDKAA